jgi:prepilin-type N-terminal cleavage/methylation domain-containing protein
MRRLFARGQRGFTLVEILVAIPIAGLVVVAAAAGLIQVLNSKDAGTQMYSLRQVQTAGYWVSTDGYQAQQVGNVPGEITIGANQGFPLVFKWLDLDTNESHWVTYDLGGTPGETRTLWRYEVITNQATGEQTTSQTNVARYLLDNSSDPPGTTQVTEGDPTEGEAPLVFTVTSQVGREPIETRTYEIKPRALATTD